MSAVTQSAGPRLPQTSGEGAVREWLELLASGGCDQSAFLQSMSLRFQSEPDGSWEVLSQLDQYYRRGKIKPEVFREINAAICASALGAGDALPRAQPNTKTSQPPAAPEPKPGDTLRSRYRLESILGRGRQGCVFEALDEYRLDVPSCGQRIAVKVLHGEVASRTELLSALRRDFQQLQSLSHPNIVRVYEFDRDGPFAFFTMELLNGAPLTRVLLERKGAQLERGQALAVIRDAGAAIAHAHSRGVLHGNISPQNIFITSAAGLRVLDFGAPQPVSASPSYASCQLLEGEPPDEQDDIFALACVAHLLLSGSHPFPGSALQARAAGFRIPRPARLTNRQWRTLRAGLHWEREKRPADVESWLGHLGAERRNFTLVISLIIAIAGLLACGYWVVNGFSRLPKAEAPVAATRVERTPAPQKIPEMPAVPAEAPALAPSPAAAITTMAMSAAAAPPSAVPVTMPSKSAGPPARIEMAAATVDVPSAESSARVVVRRKINSHGEIGFTWWTESGTAKAGTDFIPSAPKLEHIEDGKTSVSLNIPLKEATRTTPASFYVVIDQAEGNAKLGRTLTMVTLPQTQ